MALSTVLLMTQFIIMFTTAVTNFDCRADGSCIGDNLNCVQEEACHIYCGKNSCTGATIDANNLPLLTITCEKDDPCQDISISVNNVKNAIINCGVGPDHENSCKGSNIIFTNSKVTFSCSGASAACRDSDLEITNSDVKMYCVNGGNCDDPFNMQVTDSILDMYCGTSACDEAFTINAKRSMISMTCTDSACDNNFDFQATDSNISMICTGGACDDTFNMNVENSMVSMICIGASCDDEFSLQGTNSDISMDCIGSSSESACDDDFSLNGIDSSLTINCGINSCDNAAIIQGINSYISVNCFGDGSCTNAFAINASESIQLIITADGAGSLTDSTIKCPCIYDSTACVINVGSDASINNAIIYTGWGFDTFTLDCQSDSCFDDGQNPIIKCKSGDECEIENITPDWNEFQCVSGQNIVCPTESPTTAMPTTAMPTIATAMPTTATDMPTIATVMPTTATDMPTTATDMPTAVPTTDPTESAEDDDSDDSDGSNKASSEARKRRLYSQENDLDINVMNNLSSSVMRGSLDSILYCLFLFMFGWMLV